MWIWCCLFGLQAPLNLLLFSPIWLWIELNAVCDLWSTVEFTCTFIELLLKNCSWVNRVVYIMQPRCEKTRQITQQVLMRLFETDWTLRLNHMATSCVWEHIACGIYSEGQARQSQRFHHTAIRLNFGGLPHAWCVVFVTVQLFLLVPGTSIGAVYCQCRDCKMSYSQIIKLEQMPLGSVAVHVRLCKHDCSATVYYDILSKQLSQTIGLTRKQGEWKVNVKRFHSAMKMILEWHENSIDCWDRRESCKDESATWCDLFVLTSANR